MAKPALVGDYTLAGDDRSVLAAVFAGYNMLLVRFSKLFPDDEQVRRAAEGIEVGRRILRLSRRFIGIAPDGMLSDDSRVVGELCDMMGIAARDGRRLVVGVEALRQRVAEQNDDIAELSRLRLRVALLEQESAALQRRQNNALMALVGGEADR